MWRVEKINPVFPAFPLCFPCCKPRVSRADRLFTGPQSKTSHPIRGALRINGGNQADEAQLLAAGLELLVRGDLLACAIGRECVG